VRRASGEEKDKDSEVMAMICVMCGMNYLPEDLTCVGACKHCWPKYQEEHERRMVEIRKRMQEMKEPACRLKQDVDGLQKEVERS